MKNWLFVLVVLINIVACKDKSNQSQSIENKAVQNVFDISRYRYVLENNKVFTPEAGSNLIDSIRTVRNYQNFQSLLQFRLLDSMALFDVFQDSTDYYKKGIPGTGGFTFHFNSLVFETPQYCGIVIDRITYDCGMTKYKAFLLVYKKGKLMGVSEIASATQMMSGLDVNQTKSKLINNNCLLVEKIDWRFEEGKKINQVDTLAKLITFGLSEKLKIDTIYQATKPFEKVHIFEERNPLNGNMGIRRLLFFKEN